MIGIVTRDGWNAGSMQSASHPLGYDAHVLSVFKVVQDGPWKAREGDHNGRIFFDRQELDRFKVERGYCEPYMRVDYALARHMHRKELSAVHKSAMRAIRGAESAESIQQICSECSALVASITGNVLARSHWSCGFHMAARRLRPDLIKPLTF